MIDTVLPPADHTTVQVIHVGRERQPVLVIDNATGTLAAEPAPAFVAQTALTVVVAARGYPGTPVAGGAVGGIAAAEETGATVFQAGTRAAGDTLVAAGGRVLAVTALGDGVAAAQAAAYRAVDALDVPDGFCRRDIGWRAVAREAVPD